MGKHVLTRADRRAKRRLDRQAEKMIRLDVRASIANLVYARMLHGISRREVAERMGIRERDVRRLESRRADPHLSTLRRYCMAIGVVTNYQVYVPREEWKA